MTFTAITTKEMLVAYLNQLSVAILSTSSPDGIPHAAVVYFIVDHNLNFYFLTLSNTQKAKNLKENFKVALTTLDLSTMITMQSNGIVGEIRDIEQHRLLIKEINEVNIRKNIPKSPPPVSNLENAGGIIVYKYTPTWLRVGNYSEEKISVEEGKQENNLFVEIIPSRKPAIS